MDYRNNLFVPIRKVGRTRKKKRRKLPLILLMGAAVASAIWYFTMVNPITKKHTQESASDESPSTSIYAPCNYVLSSASDDYTRYAEYFNDEQDVQIIAAEKFGVPPGTSLSGGDYIMLRNTTKYYLHKVGYPYLVPKAADLLNKICEMYQQELNDPSARLRLTSCLRTPESVKKLQRNNGNAVENSCHLYGTTFDISYSPLEPHEKRALAKVLSILRESGYCYVKHERKQPCFHITISK